jgi:hypothetical protein
MFRLHAAVAALCLGAALLPSAASAQSTSQQPMTSVLAGKKFTPPIKGEAVVEFTQPVTKKDPKTNMVVTKITVRNASNAPIPRLTIDETWFDKSGALVTGGKGVINGLLQPGEVKVVEITTPYNAKMNSNSWNFSHANGTVKPKKVKSLDEASKEPAAKNASATKKKP